MNIECCGQTALITGGSRGIGSAIVKSFLESRAVVYYTGTTPDGDSIDHPNAHYLQVDFSDDVSVEKFLTKIRDLKIDILVNNAGINKISSFGEIQNADWLRVQKVNVEGPFLLCKTLAPLMAQRKYGRIVNLGSIFSEVSKEFRGSYSTSKFAIVGMTKALALEYGKFNVLANVVSPGFIDTELTRKILTPEQIEELVARVPVGRLGTPKEIANFILFIASSQNTFINAQNILVDGGFTSA